MPVGLSLGAARQPKPMVLSAPRAGGRWRRRRHVGGQAVVQTAFVWDPIERLLAGLAAGILSASPACAHMRTEAQPPPCSPRNRMQRDGLLAETDAHAEPVLILDFGSQVTQLIARRLREAGVYCEIWPFNADPSASARSARAPSSCRAGRLGDRGRRAARA